MLASGIGGRERDGIGVPLRIPLGVEHPMVRIGYHRSSGLRWHRVPPDLCWALSYCTLGVQVASGYPDHGIVYLRR